MLRYAKGASENEPEKTWSASLCTWIWESVGYWNEVDRGSVMYYSYVILQFPQPIMSRNAGTGNSNASATRLCRSEVRKALTGSAMDCP